jgi:hypothetical protein
MLFTANDISAWVPNEIRGVSENGRVKILISGSEITVKIS